MEEAPRETGIDHGWEHVRWVGYALVAPGPLALYVWAVATLPE